MIRDLDLVALKKPLPRYGLQSGDIGSVVLVMRDKRVMRWNFQIGRAHV